MSMESEELDRLTLEDAVLPLEADAQRPLDRELVSQLGDLALELPNASLELDDSSLGLTARASDSAYLRAMSSA